MSLARCNHCQNDEKANSLENSKERDTSKHTEQSTHDNDQLMRNMRKELDKVKDAMKGKTTINLDGIIKRTYSPFTTNVLECPLPLKFCLPQLEVYDGTKDPLDHIGAFKKILNLQQTLDEVICQSFSATLRGVARVWFSKLPALSNANFE